MTRAVKIARRCAPCVKHVFDARALRRGYALPFVLSEGCVEGRVYGGKDVFDGHAVGVVGRDDPIPREEVGNDA